MGEKQNEEIARRAVEAWNASDWDPTFRGENEGAQR
jgi:hypothetical protein